MLGLRVRRRNPNHAWLTMGKRSGLSRTRTVPLGPTTTRLGRPSTCAANAVSRRTRTASPRQRQRQRHGQPARQRSTRIGGSGSGCEYGRRCVRRIAFVRGGGVVHHRQGDAATQRTSSGGKLLAPRAHAVRAPKGSQSHARRHRWSVGAHPHAGRPPLANARCARKRESWPCLCVSRVTRRWQRTTRTALIRGPTCARQHSPRWGRRRPAAYGPTRAAAGPSG